MQRTKDDVLINHAGVGPADHFTIISNVLMRDTRLSLRARGLMAMMQTHRSGYRLSSEGIASQALEGRDAVRTAMRELEALGYITRTQVRDERGRVDVRVDLYPAGDAPGHVPFAPVSPPTGFPAPVHPAPVDQSLVTGPLEDQEEDQLLVADASTVDTSKGQPRDVDVPLPRVEDDGAAAAADGTYVPMPWTLIHLLRSWFNVETTEQADAWLAAWNTAAAITQGSDFSPEVHLTTYLTRCREERRDPRSSHWLRFFVEDRARYVQQVAHTADRLDLGDDDDPDAQRRKMRLLSRTPDWGTQPTTEEQHDERSAGPADSGRDGEAGTAVDGEVPVP